MNHKDIVKAPKISHTPVLKKVFKDLRKINSKFIDDPDDLEKHTALILEDEEIQRNIIAKKLPKDFKWYSAKSVKEAVEVYENLQSKYITVDVLFLDLFLQDSKGTEFLTISKTKGWLENTLIAVMTGSKDLDTIKECIECLGNRFYKFYSKPVKDIEFERLLDEIKKHIDKISCPLKGYKIIKHVGAGAQADVYKVISLKNKKIYAMKVNKDKNLNSKEVQCLKKINSPTIIHLYESQILKEKEYMILEFAERGTLYERIKEYSKLKKKFNEIQILDWMIQIFIGLYSLHKKDIMHRDIKSDNLFLCNNDVVKIGDLGQASNESKCKSFVGTFFYRAPECQDFGEYTKEIDIWSAGVVLYELIMLCRPFEGIEQKEVQKSIENIDYKPIPNDTDIRLKKLLELTLTYKENRATAAQLLSLEFIKMRINHFYKSKILELETPLYEEISKLNYKIEEINRSKANIKEYNFFKCFQNLQMIYYKYSRTSLYSELYLNKIQVYVRSCLFNKSIKEEEIKDLIDLGVLVPYEINKNKQNEKKVKKLKTKKSKYDSKYYILVKNKIDGIDNTLNLPINDDDFFDNFYLDALETSFKAFEKAKKTFNLFRRILEDEDINEEEKYYYASCEDMFEFLIECKNFQNINLEKYVGDEKISIMLNIYQTMIYHYIMKYIMDESEYEEKASSSLFQTILASLKLGKYNISIKYKIAGEIFTIQDMKHIVFKIKSPTIFFLYQPLTKDDQRLKLLDEKYLNNLSILNRLAILTVCIDPPNMDDEVSDIYAPIGICFKPTTLTKDLNSSLYHFISEKNIFPDENTINFPKMIHDYILELGEKEKDVIQRLIEFFYKDFNQKMFRLINKYKQNILHINYC